MLVQSLIYDEGYQCDFTNNQMHFLLYLEVLRQTIIKNRHVLANQIARKGEPLALLTFKEELQYLATDQNTRFFNFFFHKAINFLFPWHL